MTALLLTFNLLCVADAGTTHVELGRGGTEAWLPIRNPWIVDGVIGGTAAGATISLHTLAPDHPRLAKGLAIALVIVRGMVVLHNVRHLARPPS